MLCVLITLLAGSHKEEVALKLILGEPHRLFCGFWKSDHYKKKFPPEREEENFFKTVPDSPV